MSYQKFSQYYDRLMEDFPYQRYVDFIAPKPLTKGLDLCCGTGRMTALLAERGVVMQGLDLSQDMLNQAISTTRAKGLSVIYRCGDMRSFEFTSPYDLITVVSDGLNYVAPAELGALISHVSSALVSGGQLVFDVSTPYKLQRVLGDALYYEDYDDLTYFWQNTLHPDTCSVDLSLTFFERKGTLYERFDEEQTQYWHEWSQIEAACSAAGLRLVSWVDGDTFAKPKSSTCRWICKWIKA